MALAEEHLDNPDPKGLSICFRSGLPVQNEGRQPSWDYNDVPWLECQAGCEPAPEAEVSCVPLDYRLDQSVFDPTKLSPDDTLYEEPEDPAAERTSELNPDAQIEPWPPAVDPFLRPRAPLREDRRLRR